MLPALLMAVALQGATGGLADAAPDDKAAGLASLDLLYGCLLPLPAFDTAAAYAAQAEKLGTGLPPPAPAWAQAVRVDGLASRGCRVRYMGPKADTVWASDVRMLRSLAGGAAGGASNGCAFTSDTPTRLQGVCVSTGDGQNGRAPLIRRADVRLERLSDAPSGLVTATVSDSRP